MRSLIRRLFRCPWKPHGSESYQRAVYELLRPPTHAIRREAWGPDRHLTLHDLQI